jgi:hypothetical protein
MARMATHMRLNAALSRMFGLFLFVVAVGNALVGSLDFAIVFGVVGFVFLSLSAYITSNPEAFSASSDRVDDRLVQTVVIGGWVLVLVSALVVVALLLQ